jgi:hypothetical protein
VLQDSSTFIFNGSNLGLGVSTITAIGTGYTTMQYSGSNGSGISLYRGATSNSLIYGDSNGLYLQLVENLPMFFWTNNTERMRLDASGNLLLGTTSPGAGVGYSTKIAVDGGSGEPSIFKTSAGVSGTCIRAWNSATTGNNSFEVFQTEAGGTERGNINYNRAGGLVAYNTTSDYRAKDIYGPVTNSGEVIDSVPVYMGKMKEATQERPMFIAHETPAYAHTGEKDAVDADGNPIYQQMDASALVPILWAEVKSLRARIAALEAK